MAKYNLGNKVTNDFTDPQYKQVRFCSRETSKLFDCEVAFLFCDPLNTAVVERGLASRGLSVDKARRLVNNEIQMREATQFQGKFLSSCRE